ncbi:MAG: MFS transporter [Theionarchaea archaeon]|nr:MFS transporter [Theionarchaea archaeon]
MERRMLGVFSAISFLVGMRKAVFVPFFSLYLRNELVTSYTQIGIILTLMTVVNALFQIVWGWTSDRVAKRKHFIIMGEGISGIVFLFLPQITNIAVLAALLICVNILWSMATPAWKALIAEHSNPGERGDLVGKITTCAGIGGILAFPIIGELISRYGYVYLFYFCSFCMLLISFAALFGREPEGLQPSNHRLLSIEQVRTLYTQHRLFSVYTFLIFLSVFASNLIEGFMSLYIMHLGASVKQFSYLFMLRDGSETILMIPMGKLTDRIGRVKMLEVSLAISALAVLLFAAAPVWWYLWLFIVVESIGYSGYYVSSFAVLSSLTPKEMRGTYMGFHSMTTSFSGFASSVGGSIADMCGLRILFFCSFAVSFLVVVYFVTWLRKHNETISQSEN